MIGLGAEKTVALDFPQKAILPAGEGRLSMNVLKLDVGQMGDKNESFDIVYRTL